MHLHCRPLTHTYLHTYAPALQATNTHLCTCAWPVRCMPQMHDIVLGSGPDSVSGMAHSKLPYSAPPPLLPLSPPPPLPLSPPLPSEHPPGCQVALQAGQEAGAVQRGQPRCLPGVHVSRASRQPRGPYHPPGHPGVLHQDHQ